MIKMDNGPRYKFGEKPIYNKWIWQQGPVYDLTEGEHNFFVWNEEVSSQMDILLFNTDLVSKPSGFGEFHSIVFDFENEEEKVTGIYSLTGDWKIINNTTSLENLKFCPEDILKPNLIAEKLTESEDFFNQQLIKFLPLYLKIKIDDRLFDTITPKEISDFFNQLISESTFLRPMFDRSFIGLNSEAERVSFRRYILITNFYNDLAELNITYYSRALYLTSTLKSQAGEIVFNSSELSDFHFSFDYKYGDLFPDHDFLVLFNMSDTNNYYKLQIQNKTVSLQKSYGGEEFEVGSVEIEEGKLESGFNTLTILREFPRIIVMFNQESIISITDSTIKMGILKMSSMIGDLYLDKNCQETSLNFNYQHDYFNHLLSENDYIPGSNGFWYQSGKGERYL